jgi:signal peptidase I
MASAFGRRAASVFLSLAALILTVPVLGHVTGRWRFVPVLSGSMTPAFSAGSLVLATPVPLVRLRVGDVVIYRIPVGDHHLIVHRIVRLDHSGGASIVETKGDANRAVDPWRARLNGSRSWIVRTQIPLLGYASIFAQRLGLLVLLLSISGVAVAWGLRRIWRGPPTPLERERDQRAALPT